MPQLTHWRKLSDTKYLGAWDIPVGGELTLTIKSAMREEVEGENGKKDNCGVIHFVENYKPLVANVTNRKMIAKVLGSNYAEEWAGKKIVLGVDKVKYKGELTDAVRVRDKVLKNEVRPVQTDPAIPPHTCADCKAAIVDVDGHNAADIEARAIKRYNVPLCLSCAMKRAQPKMETPPEDVPFTEPPEAEPDSM
jgi:hypothetical protein